MSLLYSLFLFYQLLNMFRATMCPSSGADDCVMIQPRVGMQQKRNKEYKSDIQLVFLIHTELRCTVNHTSDVRNVFGLLICVVNEHICVDEVQNFQEEDNNKQRREECKLKKIVKVHKSLYFLCRRKEEITRE